MRKIVFKQLKKAIEEHNFSKVGHDMCTVPGYEYSSMLLKSNTDEVYLLLDIEEQVSKFDVKVFDSKEDTETYLIENDINISL